MASGLGIPSSAVGISSSVLGVFPIFLAALDLYRTGFGVLKFTRQNNRDIDVLRKRVHTEHVRLSKLLEMLFEPMGVEIGNVVEWDSTRMPGAMLDALLEERLSGAYPVFFELMSAIAICMKELVRRFEKLDSTSALRTKLRLISSREDIERLVRKLIDYNDSLHNILLLKLNLNSTPSLESTRVRELLSNAKMAQRDVNILCKALYPVKGTLSVRKLFLESFRLPNLWQYRRQLQVLLAPLDSSVIRKRHHEHNGESAAPPSKTTLPTTRFDRYPESHHQGDRRSFE